jgi:Na+/melibiose symporter-like transporter
VWVFVIVVTALVAGSKNRSAGGWAFAGALFGVFALIAVACCAKLPTAAEAAAAREAANTETKLCPRCAETVKAAAQVCRFCGHEFDPSTVLVEPQMPALP